MGSELPVYSHKRRARCWRGWIRLFIQQIIVSFQVRGGEPEVNSVILALMAARSAGIFAAGFFFHEGRGVPALSTKGASPCSRFGGATSLQSKKVGAHPLAESTIGT